MSGVDCMGLAEEEVLGQNSELEVERTQWEHSLGV